MLARLFGGDLGQGERGLGDVITAFDLDALNVGNLGLRLGADALEREIDAKLSKLTLPEKLALMAGDFVEPTNGLYTTPGSAVHGIAPLKMVDGPRGVRAGVATTFPVAMARGATWDTELEAQIGQAIAREARAKGANVLLAPAINLLRHPGWGRAQETYGEDPLHVGRMGAAFVAGAQRELVASVKHFALNSIEDTRFEVDVEVDARTLHEVYLPHFELCVRGARVGSVMSAYNRVNGDFCAENPGLIRDILKRDWGFLGFVESDWVFGTRSTDASLRAGLDIEMPEAHHYGKRLHRAVLSGRVSENMVDEAVRRILRVGLAFNIAAQAREAPNMEVVECHAHQELALRAAHESFVLLKNEHNLLPLHVESDLPVAVIGKLSALENTGDQGSSAVTSSFVISALEGLTDRLPSRGVRVFASDELSDQDCAALLGCKVAIVVVGLTYLEEGERIPLVEGGGDRTSLRLSPAHEALVHKVSAIVPRTVVIIEAGSAVEVRSFVDQVPALLLAWYPGMLGGEALYDVLFGRVSPSGKLPISMARAQQDLVPFNPQAKRVRYGFLHGYRWLEAHACAAEFPFGFGLSYTRFGYEGMRLSARTLAATDELDVWVSVRNLGERSGVEVVQLYLRCESSAVARAPKTLAGFGRLALAPGEQKQLKLTLTERELAYFDVKLQRFVVEPGRYILCAGSSSQDLPLEACFDVV